MSTRPVRSTRGVRTTPLTQEEQIKQDIMYKAMFGNIKQNQDSDNNENQGSEEDSDVRLDHLFPTLLKSQKAQFNTANFPYSRGCHYFYNLLNYPRLGTTSYVQDIHPYGTFHDQHNKSLFLCGDTTLFNRKYFGLPERIRCDSQPKDKNVCHQYLFKNQDRKWRLDQQLYELKYIFKHPEILQGNKSKNYYFLKRDVELSPLYLQETAIQQKIALLKSKIQFLQHRKQKLLDQLAAQDDFFYHTSLNQQFFNEKDKHDSEFNIQNILLEAICMSQMNMELFDDTLEQQNGKIQVLFSIFTTLNVEVAHPTYRNEYQHYIQVGKPEGLVPPSFIFSFRNKEHLDWVGQSLSIRILQTHGDTAFYSLKSVWQKLFQYELIFQQQYTPIDKWEYIEAIKSVIEHHRIKELSEQQKVIPNLPPYRQSQTFQFYLQKSQAPNSLSSKQYLILYFIYYLYQRVGVLNMDYRIVGSQMFQKYQYKLCQKLGTEVSSFQLTLKKCIEVVLDNFVQSQMPAEFYFQSSENNAVTLVWVVAKESHSQNEGEQNSKESNDQQQSEEDEQQQNQDDQNDGDSLQEDDLSESRGQIPKKRQQP